jgi:anion-transporting  ArsA/GET3 family ATPase
MRRYASSQKAADAILANPFYRNITERFAHSHEYIAMERLYELHAEGTYDLLVIDTPPSRSALDFLDAPKHMAELFSSRVLRWLTTPARSRLIGLASRPFYEIADRVLGTQLLEDIASFLALFQGMYPGFIERAESVASLMRDERTTFMVVSTLESAPWKEARRLLSELDRRSVHVGLLVANKALSPSFSPGSVNGLLEVLAQRSEQLADALISARPDRYPDASRLRRVLEAVGESFANFQLLANREAELFEDLALAHDVRVLVPHLMRDVDDLGALIEIGERLFRASEES